MKNLQAIRRDRKARKWFLIKVIDVILAAISTPLAFYVALVYDKGVISVFAVSMALLIVFSTIGLLITWWVWEQIKKESKDGMER
jgi:hypothetical protein